MDTPPALTLPAATGGGRNGAVFRLTLGFIALVILTFAGVEGWRAWRDYQQAFAQANDTVVNLARATAQHAEDAIRQVDVLTDALGERIEGDGLDHLDVPRVHALLVQQAAIMPQLDGLYIYGPDGRWVVTDKDIAPESANNADRDYFIYHRTHDERRVRIGEVVRSRSTDQLIIPVSRRLDNPDGTFAGVLLGTVRVSYFVDFYGDFKIDDKGAIVLAMRNGRILVRRPFIPGITEQSLAQSEIFRRYLPLSDSGVAQIKAVVDGTDRLYGYRALSRYPLVVEAGLSRESFVGPWRRGVIKTVLFLLVLIAGLSGFGFIVLSQLRQRMVMENALLQAHRAMEEMALTDSLTGLGNRRRLDLVLEQEVGRARRQGYCLAMIMLDVDYFKRFNDRYGHSMGDECLRQVGAVIRQTLKRPADLAVRYGGEEFTVLLPDTTSTGASQIAEALLQAIRALHIEHADHPLGFVTASAGIATCLPMSDVVTPVGLIKAADAFLYMAKNNGRDRWHSALGNSTLEPFAAPPS
ncbi:sensor domain-containing diguanylate cyclase [Pseudomonas sp. dw_358]|uniref:sensor domain-containing diguanylate cyclase n=1 Tax=Pseudomonas sp. dw_358 TaxID=2720083 RepID=UPI001BD3FA88|nr:sensor domain-containing diguanylate cyclase [Pseudomonas sp. dw_358]